MGLSAAVATAALAFAAWGGPSDDLVTVQASAAPAAKALRLAAPLTIDDRTESIASAAAPSTAAAPSKAASSPKPVASSGSASKRAIATRVAPSVPKAVGKKWTTSAVNVRALPTLDSDQVDKIAALTQVDVTGETQNGWTQVLTDAGAGWVKSTYLSASKPKASDTDAAPSSTKPAVSTKPCKISASIESHLSSKAEAVYRAVCAAYGDSVSSFGGYRPGDDGDHGTGRAVDIMVSGDPGWTIAKFVQAHASQLGVTYVIYQQRIWMAGDPISHWKLMGDRGSRTANHYDHVHVSVR